MPAMSIARANSIKSSDYLLYLTMQQDKLKKREKKFKTKTKPKKKVIYESS